MPYDIYGNTLRQGYCEVHPDTRGSYPCDQCMAEYWYEQDARYLEAAYYAQAEADYHAYLRTQYYRDRCSQWLLHTKTGQPLPDWYHRPF